jgi:hypothetical protein
MISEEELKRLTLTGEWPFIRCVCGHEYWAHWFKTTEHCGHCDCSKLRKGKK